MSRYGYIKHSELAHHGILGQRWGKRNGPPYPLDASDHSAQEKRLNGGRYTQGVKQDRSGKSYAGKGKKELTPEEKAERARKIKKGLAIGAGVAGAAAATAGAIYLAKHPETAKMALKGVKNMAVNAVGNIRDRRNLKRMSNDSLMGKGKDLARDMIKRSKEAAKAKFKEDFKNANLRDKADIATRKENRAINRSIAKQDRKDKRNERKGILNDVTSDAAREDMIKNPWKISVNKDKIEKSSGTKAFNDLIKEARLYESNTNYASNKTAEKKANSGVKGVVNKVWKPVAATAGVVGTVGGVANRINSGINAVGQLANNPYAKKAYKAYMNSGYDDYYDDYYNQQPKKKKKS